MERFYVPGVVIAQYIVFHFLNTVLFTPRDKKIIAGEIRRYTFSDHWTITLQHLIGTRNILAWFLSAYYVFGFAICTAFSIPLLAAIILNGGIKRLWIYLLIAAIMWFVDLLVFYVYPVAPPIRLNIDLKFDNVDYIIYHDRINLLVYSITLYLRDTFEPWYWDGVQRLSKVFGSLLPFTQ